MSTFLIKKNPTSNLNPWLCSVKVGAATGKGFCTLHDALLSDTCKLISFNSEKEARAYIEQNPVICSSDSIICQLKAAVHSIELVPV